MRLALLDSHRVLAEPRASGATCPHCLTPVIARCGTLRAWHWAHAEGTCDSWLAPDSEWTNEWKSHFPPEWCEAPRGSHLADIALPDRALVLAQLSLTESQIAEREADFTPMAWVVQAQSTDVELHPDPEGFVRFTWHKPRNNWLCATQPVVLDHNTTILLIKKMRPARVGIRGWGYHYSRDLFIKECGGTQ